MSVRRERERERDREREREREGLGVSGVCMICCTKCGITCHTLYYPGFPQPSLFPWITGAHIIYVVLATHTHSYTHSLTHTPTHTHTHTHTHQLTHSHTHPHGKENMSADYSGSRKYLQLIPNAYVMY